MTGKHFAALSIVNVALTVALLLGATSWIAFAQTGDGSVDSLFRALLPDSTHVASWVTTLAARWVPMLPHPWAEVVAFILTTFLGIIVSLIVDLLEKGAIFLAAKLQRVPWAGAALSWLVTLWQSNPKVANPLLALATGWLAAGNPLVGIIAAGVRSMGTRPINEWALRRLRLAAVALALGVAMLGASPAGAQPAPADSIAAPAAHRILPEWLGLRLTAGYHYAFAGIPVDLPKFEPFAGGGLDLLGPPIVGLPYKVGLTLRRDLHRDWTEAEVAISVAY